MPERPTNIRWLIVLMLMGFTFQGHFNRLSITVAGNRFIKSDGMSPEHMGVVYSTFGWVYTIGMLPGGWLIDRFGPRRSLAGMGVGLGACSLLTGTLGFLPWSIASLWGPLLLIRGVAGVCSVPLHPGAARTVSLWIPLSGRATANGLVTAGALVGIALTYPGFGWLMDRYGWPLAFVISGGVLMAFSAAWTLLSSDSAADHRGTNSAEKDLVGPAVTGAPKTAAPLHDFVELLRCRGLVLLSLSYAALSYFQYLFFYWIEHYFEQTLGLPVQESRQAAFYVTMSMAVGMACGGWLADAFSRRFGRRWGYRVLALAAMVLSAGFGWAGISSEDANRIVVCFSLAMGSLGLCEGIFWTTAPLLQQKSGGMAGAFLNTVGNAGGFVAPLVTPWIGVHYGWNAALAVACLICGLGAFLWFWIDPEPAPNVA